MDPPPTDPVVPDYDGACISRVVLALLGDRRAPWLPPSVAEAKAIVLMVLDGLGWHALEEHRGDLPELAAFDGAAVTSVTPATTAAALTSLATGLPPSVHGLVGFRMRVGDGVLNVLSWQYTGRGRKPDPFTMQRHPTFGRRAIPVVTQSEFRDTPFTEAHLRGARFEGWPTTAVLVERCRRLVASGERFVEVYYPGVDKVAHEFGLRDGYYAAELRAADALVGELRDALPSEAVLVVVSDHGQVHVESEQWVGVEELAPMLAMQAGDPRFRYLYARAGAAKDLAAAARERFSQDAWVLTREELIESGWLGPPPAGSIGHRYGDVTLAARRPVAFVDPAMPREPDLRSVHGSLTAEEMLVPLLAARGRGPC